MASSTINDRQELSHLEQCELIEDTIRLKFSRRIQDFHIRMVDHDLVLEGRTRFYHIKQEAQQVLMKMTKLRIRDNNIIVDSIVV